MDCTHLPLSAQDQVTMNVSPSLQFGFTDDDIAKDCRTVCDSISYDEAEDDGEIVCIAPDESCPATSFDCYTDSAPVEAPSQISPGYVGVKYN